jgi:enoyl-CoA hydratase/3-hydroxyacyl-CoA dehydrogenase
MLDRIFDNWVNECGYLLDRATAQEIDKVATEFVAAGPFWVVDMSNGNPIIVETNTRQMEAEGECYRPAHIFNSVLRWKVSRHAADIEVPEETAAVVRDRLLGILFSQSLDIIARGIGTAADLELGCELALGFTRGPLALMRERGKVEVEGVLTRFEADRPGFPGLDYMDRFEELIATRKYLLVDRVDDVVVITIRRPAQLNALSDEVNDEILSVLEEYENDDSVTGFVLTGYGMRAFCAGADIGRFPEMLGDAEASAQYARDSSRLLTYIDGMRKPLVAALNGLALGGGAELAMRCHDRVCCRDTYLQFPEVTLGILPGIGGLVVPYRKWPQAADRFTTMLARGDRMKASEALELGILSAVAAEYPELIALAVKSVRALAGRVPLAYADHDTVAALEIEEQEASTTDGRPLSKEAVSIILKAVRDGVAAPDLSAALEIGYRAFGAVAATSAAKEGIGAFVEGRKPDFTGM